MPKTTEEIILKSIHNKEIPIMTVWWEQNYNKIWYSKEEITKLLNTIETEYKKETKKSVVAHGLYTIHRIKREMGLK